MDCLFCKIINGDIPSAKVYENEHVYAFKDINPCAPVHVLIVPKTHIGSIDEINETNTGIVDEVLKVIPVIAAQCGLTNGYRVITNVGEDGGQTVKHLHFHLIGGTKLAIELNGCHHHKKD
ncbi:MAG: histidine triad nucleotide-binding protein [Clostridia bacterium]|nr:histidine triad nucleotide-binding protein [Clostridia bacterium]